MSKEMPRDVQDRIAVAKALGLADEDDYLAPYKFVFLFRINIRSVLVDEIDSYLESVKRKLSISDQGILTIYVPTRDERTSLAIINLDSMQVGEL